jgi:hypothetical protein
LHLKEITPYTRLIYSGNYRWKFRDNSWKVNSRDFISVSDLLVFIKWKGIRILEREPKRVYESGGKLRVIINNCMLELQMLKQ